MSGYVLIVIVLCIEVGVFLAEVLLSSLSRKNRQLKRANRVEDVKFIDLEKGFKTGISVFRISMFVAYVLLVILLLDSSTAENSIEEFILYILIGVLIYMLSLVNMKIFSFYSTYFVIGSPFHFLRKDIIIRYEEIDDFRLYRALYNAYYLRLKLKNAPDRLFQFAATYLPRNDLVIRIILNSKITNYPDIDQILDDDDFL